MIPRFEAENKCVRHGNLFKENDELLRLSATHVVLYEENKETVYPCKVYYRETEGHCKCQQQYDGHDLLLFHMGLGRMVCYFTI